MTLHILELFGGYFIQFKIARKISYRMRVFTIAAQVPVMDAPTLDPAKVGKTHTPPLHSVVTKY